MNENYSPVLAALVKEGFHQLPDSSSSSAKELDFKITEYSLNTTLSFKFESLPHLIEFLKLSQKVSDEKIALLQNTFLELGIDPHNFFYVNFFEKGKELEM